MIGARERERESERERERESERERARERERLGGSNKYSLGKGIYRPLHRGVIGQLKVEGRIWLCMCVCGSTARLYVWNGTSCSNVSC
jgi:hypothetical protein